MTTRGAALAVEAGAPPSGLFTSQNNPPNDLLPGSGESEVDPAVAGFDTLYVKAAGQVLANSRRYGVRYRADGRLLGEPHREDVRRRKSKKWLDVAAHLRGLGWCEEEVEEARQSARLLSPERKVERLTIRPWAWDRWVWLLEFPKELQPQEAVQLLGLCVWWHGEHMAQRQRGVCGTRTAEHAGRLVGTGQSISKAWRMLCGSWRCPHCARVHHGTCTAARVSLGWEAARADGRWLWFVTLTVDWEAYFRAQGIERWPVDAKRSVAWAQVGRFWGWLRDRDLVREGIEPVAMWARKSEKHQSGFPHLHFLWALRDDPDGESDLGSLALREAGCSTTEELLERLAAWEAHPVHQRRQAAWQERLAAWEASGRQGRRPAKPFHPQRLPFSRTRKRLERAVKRSGFGHLDLKPVDPSTFETPSDPLLYFAKPFDGMASFTDIPDTGRAVGRLQKEFRKAVQVEGALPSGTRIVGWSRSWPKLAPQSDSDRIDPETATFAIHSAPIEQLRDLALARGFRVVGEVTRVDFRGPIPERGQRRPVVLEGFLVELDQPGLTVAEDGLVEPPAESGESAEEPSGTFPPCEVGEPPAPLVGEGCARGPPRVSRQAG